MGIDLIKLTNQLKQDFISNTSTLGFIENNPITEVAEVNNSFLIKGTSDVEWTYVVTNNESDLKVLLEQSGGNSIFFASVEDWMIPVFTEKRKAEWILNTMRYYLPENFEVPENKK